MTRNDNIKKLKLLREVQKVGGNYLDLWKYNPFNQKQDSYNLAKQLQSLSFIDWKEASVISKGWFEESVELPAFAQEIYEIYNPDGTLTLHLLRKVDNGEYKNPQIYILDITDKILLDIHNAYQNPQNQSSFFEIQIPAILTDLLKEITSWDSSVTFDNGDRYRSINNTMHSAACILENKNVPQEIKDVILTERSLSILDGEKYLSFIPDIPKRSPAPPPSKSGETTVPFTPKISSYPPPPTPQGSIEKTVPLAPTIPSYPTPQESAEKTVSLAPTMPNYPPPPIPQASTLQGSIGDKPQPAPINTKRENSPPARATTSFRNRIWDEAPSEEKAKISQTDLLMSELQINKLRKDRSLNEKTEAATETSTHIDGKQLDKGDGATLTSTVTTITEDEKDQQIPPVINLADTGSTTVSNNHSNLWSLLPETASELASELSDLSSIIQQGKGASS